jgi:heme A synthase
VQRFTRLAWGTLAWTVLVVVWGAYVRASGSGAGCGNHWPACNGMVIPQSPSAHTLIEFTHRMMTSVDTVLIVAMLVLAWRFFPRSHPVRTGAALSMAFLVTEALLGAALVKWNLVVDNRSTARIWMMALHLVNTLVLLACVTLTAWWARGGGRVRLRGRGAAGWAMIGAVLAFVAVAAAGAVTALGDTLYPKTHVGFAEATAATFLDRLRVVHPLLAVLTTVYVVFAGGVARRARPGGETEGLSRLLVGLIVAQVMAGVFNLAMLAPVWMQLVHLALADGVWIALVCAAAAVLADEPAPAPAVERARVTVLAG